IETRTAVIETKSSANSSADRLFKPLSRTQFGRRAEAAQRSLWLIAIGLTNDTHLAEDVVQEALANAWRKVDQFNPATSFTAWTAQFVRNVALNARRKRRKAVSIQPAQLDLNPGYDFVETPGPIDANGQLRPHQKHFDDHVLAALEALSGEARSCLLLRTVHGVSYERIAQLLSIPPGTAMSHVHRARQAMRQSLPVSARPATVARPVSNMPFTRNGNLGFFAILPTRFLKSISRILGCMAISPIFRPGNFRSTVERDSGSPIDQLDSSAGRNILFQGQIPSGPSPWHVIPSIRHR
ncbi:MAG: RNA polymerase sigma factor, partial [Rhodospirillales bacterium]|nr:RNA polymerase sigma factor [Rhodospirillales bacterium]